jgi:hypothetical protein
MFMAIQTFIGEIQKTLDNKQLSFGIFLDLSKFSMTTMHRHRAFLVREVLANRNVIASAPVLLTRFSSC